MSKNCSPLSSVCLIVQYFDRKGGLRGRYETHCLCIIGILSIFFCCGYLCQSCGFLPKNSLSYYDPSVKNHCGQSDEDYLNGCHILRVDTKQINHRLYVEDKIESKRNAFFRRLYLRIAILTDAKIFEGNY